jgi:DNA-directed RNA polymerase specialized sigma24 family protein
MSTSPGPERRRRNKKARELAEEFGVSVRTVKSIVAEERATYEERARGRREQIVALHRQGWTGKQIAAELGISRALVSTRLAEARAAGEDLSRLPDEDVDQDPERRRSETTGDGDVQLRVA